MKITKIKHEILRNSKENFAVNENAAKSNVTICNYWSTRNNIRYFHVQIGVDTAENERGVPPGKLAAAAHESLQNLRSAAPA